jgi:hypothetical protein
MLGRYVDLGNPVAGHPLNEGLISWWLPLPNNQGGGTLFDLKRKYDGALNNGPAWAPGPNAFASLDFVRASDQFVEADYAPLSALSCTFWFRPNSLVNYFVWVDTNNGASITQDVRVYSDSGGTLHADCNGADTTVAGVVAGAWNFAALIRTGAGTNLLYLWPPSGGPLVSPATMSSLGVASTKFRIGRAKDGHACDGRATDVRLYSRALGAAELRGLYEQGLRGHPDTLRRWSRRAYLFGTAGGGGGGVAGTLAVTLAAPTLASAGAAAVAGAASPTAPNVTAASAGTVAVAGAAAPTLPGPTLASAGASAVAGAASITLAAATLSSAGVAPVVGTLALTVPFVATVSAGTAPVVGAGGGATPAPTLSAAGAAPVVGALAGTLAAPTLQAGSSTSASGTLSVTLDAVTLSAAGAVAVAGASAAVATAPTLASAGAAAVAGQSSATLAGVILAALAAAPVAAEASVTLPPPTLAAAGGETPPGPAAGADYFRRYVLSRRG